MTDSRRFKRSSSLIARPLLAGAIAMTAGAAIDAHAGNLFLKITGIPGESQEDKHKNEIDVISFSLGFAGATLQVDTARLMKPTCGPLNVKKKLDVASGPLADALMKGTVIAEAVLASRKAGESAIDYYVVTLKNATVTSLTQSSTGDQPAEEVELLPRAVQLAYRAQKPDGAYDAAITTAIDCTGGTK